MKPTLAAVGRKWDQELQRGQQPARSRGRERSRFCRTASEGTSPANTLILNF